MNAEDNNSHLYAIIEEQKRGLLGFLQRVDWLEEEIERLREALEGVIRIADRDCPEFRAARAALAEQEEK